MSELTNRIDLLCTERNIKRADICRGTGISESTLRTWITRSASPNVEAVFKVAQFFGVSVEYLITGHNLQDAPQLYLSNEENEIIEIYRSLDNRGKSELYQIAQIMERVRNN